MADRHRFDGIYDSIPDFALLLMEKQALALPWLAIPVLEHLEPRRGICVEYDNERYTGMCYVNKPIKGYLSPESESPVRDICEIYEISVAELARAFGETNESPRPHAVTRQAIQRWYADASGATLPCLLRLAITSAAIDLAWDDGLSKVIFTEENTIEPVTKACAIFSRYTSEECNLCRHREIRADRFKKNKEIIQKAIYRLDQDRLSSLAAMADGLLRQMDDEVSNTASSRKPIPAYGRFMNN